MNEKLSRFQTALSPDDASVELSSNRTAMSFERTMMSTDRTLMSGVRTSFAMIGFGFTIFEFFHAMNKQLVDGPLPTGAAARFGGVLIVFGIILMAMAIWYNRLETRALKARRMRLFDLGLIHHPEIHRQSATMTIAVMTLILGALALLGVVFRIGLF